MRIIQKNLWIVSNQFIKCPDELGKIDVCKRLTFNGMKSKFDRHCCKQREGV